MTDANLFYARTCIKLADEVVKVHLQLLGYHNIFLFSIGTTCAYFQQKKGCKYPWNTRKYHFEGYSCLLDCLVQYWIRPWSNCHYHVFFILFFFPQLFWFHNSFCYYFSSVVVFVLEPLMPGWLHSALEVACFQTNVVCFQTNVVCFLFRLVPWLVLWSVILNSINLIAGECFPSKITNLPTTLQMLDQWCKKIYTCRICTLACLISIFVLIDVFENAIWLRCNDNGCLLVRLISILTGFLL